jgi:hypothetical protein
MGLRLFRAGRVTAAKPGQTGRESACASNCVQEFWLWTCQRQAEPGGAGQIRGMSPLPCRRMVNYFKKAPALPALPERRKTAAPDLYGVPDTV